MIVIIYCIIFFFPENEVAVENAMKKLVEAVEELKLVSTFHFLFFASENVYHFYPQFCIIVMKAIILSTKWMTFFIIFT